MAWLDVLGGGLDITMFAAIPKGSGLVISSILVAALFDFDIDHIGPSVTLL